MSLKVLSIKNSLIYQINSSNPLQNWPNLDIKYLIYDTSEIN